MYLFRPYPELHIFEKWLLFRLHFDPNSDMYVFQTIQQQRKEDEAR
jgi:hypothetical protein